MSFFPDIALLNRYYLGDSVLCEPIARLLSESMGSEVYVVSNYPDLFLGHPSIRGVSLDSKLTTHSRLIDMSHAIKSLKSLGNGRQLVLEGKMRRMYEAAGLSEEQMEAPCLYLTKRERERAEELKAVLPERRIGVALQSRHRFKNLPYMRFLVKKLTQLGYTVFLLGKDLYGDYNWLEGFPAIRVIDRPLRDAMLYISLMDQMIGPDTGLMHIAGALKVPFVVVTREIWRDLYDCYDLGKILAAKHFGKRSMCTLPVTPRRILRAVELQDKQPRIALGGRQNTPIALFRLDGLGGTLTLADQAKKIYEKMGIKPDLVIRNFSDAFVGNPHINKVVEVGHVDWGDSLAETLEAYETVAEIRFAPGRWHQKGKQLFKQDFSWIKELFEAFPMRLNEWESEGLHQVQLTDKTLGLPYEMIDMEVFNYESPPSGLPDRYVVLNNGVDAQHRGMIQTKVWPWWQSLPSLVDTAFVQVGTYFDEAIEGTIDLRGKTTIPQLFSVLRDATAIVCTEGGTMHSAFAVGAQRVLVIRGPTRGKLFHYPGQTVVDSYVCAACVGETGDWYVNCPKKISASCMATISPERVAFKLEELLYESVA